MACEVVPDMNHIMEWRVIPQRVGQRWKNLEMLDDVQHESGIGRADDVAEERAGNRTAADRAAAVNPAQRIDLCKAAERECEALGRNPCHDVEVVDVAR